METRQPQAAAKVHWRRDERWGPPPRVSLCLLGPHFFTQRDSGPLPRELPRGVSSPVGKHWDRTSGGHCFQDPCHVGPPPGWGRRGQWGETDRMVGAAGGGREDAPGRRPQRPSGGSGCPRPPQLRDVRLCPQGRHDPDGRAVPVPAPHPGLVRRPAAGGAQPLTRSPPCPGPLPQAWGKGAS